MQIIIAICGLILGIICGFIFGKMSAPKNDEELGRLSEAINEKDKQVAALEAKVASLETSLKDKDLNFDKLSQERQQAHQETLKLQKEASDREIESLRENHRQMILTIENNHKDAMEALKNQFAESANALSQQLKNTTEDMLKQRQAEFSEKSGEKIDQLLQPLKNSLKEMQEKVSENTTRHTELGGKLSAGIQNLLQHTESAQASADKLAAMLKGNAKHQGEWGERILKEILESLNLQEGIHFDLQQTLTDETGRALKNEEGRMGRPDVILHLDENKDVIIDSKVSLSAYLQYQEAGSDEERQDAIKKHIASIEKHVSELVKKDYSGYVSKPRIRLGYVIMFVPNTSALLLATKNKPSLWREAMERNVYIADEQTLYAALKIVSLTWQQIAQNANHAQVFHLAEEMMQRVASFLKSYSDIGIQLGKANKSYDEGMKKLSEGGQSIPQTCRKLINLGAKSPKMPKGVDSTLFLSDDGGEE